MNEFGEWKLSPAYDLTYSNGPGGEQSTMVMGESRNITIEHLVKLGIEAKISKELIDQIIEKTAESLSKWIRLSKDYGVRKSNIELINRALIKL